MSVFKSKYTLANKFVEEIKILEEIIKFLRINNYSKIKGENSNFLLKLEKKAFTITVKTNK